jgi:hypothetical protein
MGSSLGGDAEAPDLAPTSEDIPIRPAAPVVDWGFEFYERRLAAYSPTLLPVRLLVLASEYDGQGWARLSGDAELVEIPGDHFDLVTVRINELVGNLRSGYQATCRSDYARGSPFAPSWKDQISSAGSSKRESQQSLVRNKKGETLAPQRATKKSRLRKLGQRKMNIFRAA